MNKVARIAFDDLDPDWRAYVERLERATGDQIDVWRAADGRLVTVTRHKGDAPVRFTHSLTHDSYPVAEAFASRTPTPAQINARNRRHYRDQEALPPRGNLVATLPKDRYTVEEAADGSGWQVFDRSGQAEDDEASNLRHLATATGGDPGTIADRMLARDADVPMPLRLAAMNRLNRAVCK